MGVGIGRRQDAVDRAGAADQRGVRFVERPDGSLVTDIGGQLRGCPPGLLELMPSQ